MNILLLPCFLKNPENESKIRDIFDKIDELEEGLSLEYQEAVAKVRDLGEDAFAELLTYG